MQESVHTVAASPVRPRQPRPTGPPAPRSRKRPRTEPDDSAFAPRVRWSEVLAGLQEPRQELVLLTARLKTLDACRQKLSREVCSTLKEILKGARPDEPSPGNKAALVTQLADIIFAERKLILEAIAAE